MKITIEIDCTPQEARVFFGLPPVEAMQEALIAQLQERLTQHLEALEPEALMSLWLPGGIKGLSQLQEQFWQRMAEMQGSPKAKG